MPLKNWPPTDDWPPKDTPRSSHEEPANDEQFQPLRLEPRATMLDTVEKRPEQPLSQVTEAQAASETFKRELAALEEFRTELRESSREIEGMKQSVDHAAALRTELEQIRDVAGQLGDDYARLRDASREGREGSTAAAELVQEVEKKLESLGQRVTDIQTNLDAETRRRDEFVQDTARTENDGRALAATIATQVERFALEKKQFEAFEQRMERLVEYERQLSYLPERLEEFSRTFEALTNQANELQMKQAELAQKSDEFEQKLKALADRDPVVRAVKEELDTVQQMSAKSQADLQYISDHREDLSLLRSRLEELLTLTAAAEQKIRRNF